MMMIAIFISGQAIYQPLTRKSQCEIGVFVFGRTVTNRTHPHPPWRFLDLTNGSGAFDHRKGRRRNPSSQQSLHGGRLPMCSADRLIPACPLSKRLRMSFSGVSRFDFAREVVYSMIGNSTAMVMRCIETEKERAWRGRRRREIEIGNQHVCEVLAL
ncbi:hypothetical protein Droror1_Dr00009272 [Drosera rotundifolia]